MTEAERSTALYDMLYLVSCGINGVVPDKSRTEKMALENVYKVSRSHLLEALTYYAIEGTGLPEDAVMKKWRQSRDKAIRKNMLLNAGRAEITAFMDSIGCWYLPLKGVYLQEFYPKPGMRQMSDNDILFDPKYRSRVREWFLNSGYKLENEHVANHDAFLKDPVYNYEMHTSLYSKKGGGRPIFHKYYSNVKERLIKDNESGCGYHFSDEDFYIHMTTHSLKHYIIAGTGLRSLLDTYVFVKAKGSTLDWKYIENEAEKLEMADFEKNCRELSQKLFGEQEPSFDDLEPEKAKMLERFLFSGVYGSVQIKVNDLLGEDQEKGGKRSRSKYILKRIFPDDEYLKKWFPFFYRHKLLLPFLWIYRVVRSLTVRHWRIFEEMKILKKIK